ncbi:MAG: 3-hydroxyacyl-CoA dehydrogenase NAD-binding domain-containing protein [Actinomycetales bacterium]
MSSPTIETVGAFPDEVVTDAHVRVVDLDGARLALVTLDNGLDHNRPNTFGPASLARLDAALDEAFAVEGVQGVAVTGKPFILAAGADLSGVPRLTDRETALEIGRLGHRVFRRLGEAAVPTFCFINGLALGGGLEIALHCSYRTTMPSVPAAGLPECFLGLVPGWGGTYLLPRLIGPEAAVSVIIGNALNNNTMLKGRDLAQLGIADATFDGADFLEQSLRWAADVVTGRVTVERRPHDDSPEAWQRAVAGGRALADAKVQGAAPASYRALDLIAAARDSSRDEAFAAEDEALADLLMSDELRSGLYAFDLVQKRAKRPAGAPDAKLARLVGKVGVVGAGLMASQLALLFARRLQVPVVMTDLDQGRVDKGLAYIQTEIDKLAAKGRLSSDAANRLRALVTGSVDQSVFTDADLVIEAVFEEMSVKQQVFAGLEKVVRDDCVIATNTSSLSVTEMSAGMAHPERVVGLHFFNPVAAMPLLEVVRTPHTDDVTLATGFAVGKALKKSCVLVKDAPAFVVNRILTRFLGEVTRAVDEGTPLEVADRALAPLGLPMSPFLLLQLVGPAVALHVAETLHEAFPDRFWVSPGLARLVASGATTIYERDEAGRPEIPDSVRQLLSGGDTPLSETELRERSLQALAQEIGLMLQEGVVASPADIDLCMILGAGWPFHLGGITPYLDRAGVSGRVLGQRFLPPGVASLAS